MSLSIQLHCKIAVQENTNIIETKAHFTTFSYSYMMGRSSSAFANSVWNNLSKKDKQLLNDQARIFKKHSKKIDTAHQKKLRIPKKIHIVWIGSAKFPKDSIQNIHIWQKYHPDWQFIFWTDQQALLSPIQGMEKRIVNEQDFSHLFSFFKKSTTLEEQVSLLKHEILFKEGGVCIDHMYTPQKSFTSFHHAFDFYAAAKTAPFHKSISTYFPVSSTIFGAIAKHPILALTMNLIVNRWDRFQNLYPKSNPRDTFNRTTARTLDSFSFAVHQHMTSKKHHKTVDIIFPACMFYSDQFTEKSKKLFMRKGLVFAANKQEKTKKEKN